MAIEVPDLKDSITELDEKISNKTINVGIVGLGYVGLPLAVSTARLGSKVVGFDVDPIKADSINNGINYISDVDDEELRTLVEREFFYATTDFSKIQDMDVIIICVPTPIDKYKQPDLKYVREATNSIARYIKQGTLVILESTTYPGTTEEILKPILDSTGLVCGIDYYLAYSPERVDPGNKEYKTHNTPKVVGGMTETCTMLASHFYQQDLGIIVHEVSSPKVAEMEKLLENTFRNVNIALVNELAMLCERMDIDVWEVIDAAATKPYGFMPFYPGPGIGGHCIPIDPWYLSWKAKEFNFNTRMIEVAEGINQGMSDFVINKMMKILNKYEKTLNKSKVLVIGVAYKKDTSDYRESPVLPILDKLTNLGANWTIVDPYVEEFIIDKVIRPESDINDDVLQEIDIILITTNHSNIDYNKLLNSGKPVFDTRNISNTLNVVSNTNYYKL